MPKPRQQTTSTVKRGPPITPYTVLGIATDATPAAVHAAYTSQSLLLFIDPNDPNDPNHNTLSNLGDAQTILEDRGDGRRHGARSLRDVLDLCLRHRARGGDRVRPAEILGLQADATRQEIEDAYERVATVWQAYEAVAPVVGKVLQSARRTMLKVLPQVKKAHPLSNCVNVEDEG